MSGDPDIIGDLRIVRDMQRRVRSREYRAVRDAAILAARDEGWGLDELAAALGMSRERVRMIERRMRVAASAGEGT